jgi:hypothetical protein
MNRTNARRRRTTLTKVVDNFVEKPPPVRRKPAPMLHRDKTMTN